MKRKQHKSASLSLTNTGIPRAKWAVIAVILLMMVLGSLYLRFAWNRYQQMAQAEALQLAQSVETLLPLESIAKLSEQPGNREIPEYALVKEKLIQLVEVTSSIYYAYIVEEKDGERRILADSNPNYASAYSPLEEAYGDVAGLNYPPFREGGSVLTKPATNQWGTWIRVLTPIGDTEFGGSVAVLGISYSAHEWRTKLWTRMAADIAIVVCLLCLALLLLRLRLKHTQLQEKAKEVSYQEALYRNIFEQAPIGIALVDHQKGSIQAEFSSINPMGEAILGRTITELKQTPWPELTHEEDLKAEAPLFERFAKGEIHSYSTEKRLVRPDGSLVWAHVTIADVTDSVLYGSMYLCLLEDITARRQSEEALCESERSKSVFLAHIPGMAYRCKYDPSWTMEFVSDASTLLTGYPPESFLQNRQISYSDIISPEHRAMVWENWTRAVSQRKNFRYEYEIITKANERKWVLELGQAVYNAAGEVEALEGIVLDISEQKKKEHQIAYLREHDFLTGLYNRTHMEQEKRRLRRAEYLPLSIAVCDIDGLRVINDAYGHAEGDRLICEVASLIQGCCRKNDVLGRVSGGEFMLFLPQTDSDAAHQLMQEIQDTIQSYNRTKKDALYEINLSAGFDTRETERQSMDAVLKAAEDALKRRKLLNQNSSHSAIVSSIMATLYAKSQETEEHGQRLGKFCQMMGEHLGLAQRDLDDLQLLSKLHDIGKIGIDDRILNKPGKLTEEEWREMRQHPEIGCRIAKATPQLEHIAKHILHHHERWDGTGYPMGLKGSEIPVVPRILAIADAYDAMTEDRIYRKALSPQAALKEIEQNAGTQFDPVIAGLFAALIAQEDHGILLCPAP